MNAIQLSLENIAIPTLATEIDDSALISIPDVEFKTIIDNLWDNFNKAELQVDIRRGQALRIVRDREKIGGDNKGKGFLNWLREHDLTKSRAYSLIDLANKFDDLNKNHDLQPEITNAFSKAAFVETAKADAEVQKIVLDSIKAGDRVTQKGVKQLSNEYKAVTSDLIEEGVREQIASGALPAKYIAPLITELNKLPDSHIKSFQKEMADDSSTDNIKNLTKDAKSLNKLLESNDALLTLDGIDMEQALLEATRIDCVGLVADLTKKCVVIESLTRKLREAWESAGKLSDRLFVETGASTPNLRGMIDILNKLTSSIIEVPDVNGNKIRLQFTPSI